jgi:hypothetical protein
MAMPITLLALFFAVLATVEWQRLPLVARIYVAVATAFGLAAIAHPSMSAAGAIAHTHDGMSLLLAVARAAGFAAVMVSVATALRSLAPR